MNSEPLAKRAPAPQVRCLWYTRLMVLGAVMACGPWTACSSDWWTDEQADEPSQKKKKKRRRGRKRRKERKPGPGEPLTPLSVADRPDPSEIETVPPSRTDKPCRTSPIDSPWRTAVTEWPVHPSSEQWLASIGQNRQLNLDANHTVLDIHEPIPAVTITTRSPANSDSVPWFIPTDAKPFRPLNTQRTPRMLVFDHVHCRSYEFFGVMKTPEGWSVDTANAFDLQSLRRRRVGWHRETEGTTVQESAHDASGASVLAGLIRVDPLKQGHPIEHAIGLSVPALDRAYLPPATHGASDMSNPSFPPSGMRLRLRSTVDCTAMTGPARQICTAMQRYGLVVTSEGPTVALTGEEMDWETYRAMAPLGGLTVGDFEVVGADTPTRYGSTGTRFRGGVGVEDPDASRAPDERPRER
ncbi:MAG: hypothetical protein CL927_01345 [Deltaproteobacteria bacterium]|nr:hypothetical protein [Deltaproteobacteria bacterium]